MGRAPALRRHREGQGEEHRDREGFRFREGAHWKTWSSAALRRRSEGTENSSRRLVPGGSLLASSVMYGTLQQIVVV